MILYGKSAVGLAEDLDLFIGVDDLMEFYVDEVEKLTYNGDKATVEYQEFANNFYNGKLNRTSKKAFLKDQRFKGNFVPDEITADDLIQRFRTAFPKLNEFLEKGAEKAALRLYSRTSDCFGRIRFYEQFNKEKERRAILRAAQNFPIQSSASNMTKYASCIIKRYLDDNNLNDRIWFVISIHDEIITFVRNDFKDEWYKIMGELMEKAGEFILGNNLQKAEGNISTVWTK